MAKANSYLFTLRATLCQKSPHEVYANSRFDFARFGKDLVIRIQLPYTRSLFHYDRRASQNPTGLYTLRTFPMAISGQQGLVTELQNLPHMIVVDSYPDRIGITFLNPIDSIIPGSEVEWLSTNSCIHAVITNKPELVQQVCHFTVSKQEIKPAAHKVKDFNDAVLYVLTNVSNLLITCTNSTGNVPKVPVNCSIC